MNDVDNFSNFINQQVSQQIDITINPPIQEALNLIRLEEGYNGGGAFTKKVYHIDYKSEPEMRDMMEKYMRSILQPMENKTYACVCQAFMDLASNLEKYKRSI